MGSLMKNIAVTSSLAEAGDVFFQAVLVPEVCSLIVHFGQDAAAVA